jgi:acetyltransferase-like isoleucine patch superfamily enzyme
MMKQKTLEKVYHFFYRFQSKIYTLFLSPCFYSIGRKSTVMPPFRFNNLHSVQLGNKVTIHQGTWINVLDEGGNSHPKIVIGDHASIGMNGFISSAKKIIIGDWVLLGRNVYIADHGHEFEDISISIREQGIRKIKEIFIGSETWIGNNSVILPGASIGRHCVIGANSVVNCVIPDFSVAVGAPAEIISQYDAVTQKWFKTNHDKNAV